MKVLAVDSFPVVAVVEELVVLFDADIPTQSISKCEGLCLLVYQKQRI
jgi:hypothetical protein